MGAATAFHSEHISTKPLLKALSWKQKGNLPFSNIFDMLKTEPKIYKSSLSLPSHPLLLLSLLFFTWQFTKDKGGKAEESENQKIKKKKKQIRKFFILHEKVF